MKSYLIVLISLLTFNSGCKSFKSQNIKDTTKSEYQTILGEVIAIENGTDGYTAEIKAPNGELYFATVSIPNLGSIETYKDLEIGKKVTISGEYWKLGNENRITTRKILSTDNDNFIVEGLVQSIKNEMDGYVANIQTEEGLIYQATISIANIGKDKQFKQYQVGETANIKGELWRLGDEYQITVREILPPKNK